MPFLLGEIMKKLIIFLMLFLFLFLLPNNLMADDFTPQTDKIIHLFYGAAIGKEIGKKYKNKPLHQRIFLIESGVFFIALSKEIVDNDMYLADILYTMSGGMLFITLENSCIYLAPTNSGEGGLLILEWNF